MTANDLHFFFLGTSHDRESRRDIFTSYYEAARKKNLHCRLFDGLGSVSSSPEHPTPGTYIYDAENDKKIPCSRFIIGAIQRLFYRIFGLVFGKGMSGLMHEALLYINHLEKTKAATGEFPETINLYGFSRGADACMRLANLLYILYPQLKVNMFLVDQVPGPKRGKDISSFTVPPNVHLFHATIMIDEKRFGFEAQDVQTYHVINPQQTRMTLRAYPGHHESAMALPHDEQKWDVPKLMHDDLRRFVEREEVGLLSEEDSIPDYIKRPAIANQPDTKLAAQRLTDGERFIMYNNIQKNRSLYRCETWFPRLRRIYHKYEELYTPLAHVFVNHEHSLLFKKQYPELYHQLMSHNSELLQSLKSANLSHGELSPAKEQLLSIIANPQLKAFANKICHYIDNHQQKNTFAPKHCLPAVEDELLINNDDTYWRYNVQNIIYSAEHRLKLNFNEKIVMFFLEKDFKKALKINDSESRIVHLKKALFEAQASLSESKNDNRILFKQLYSVSQYANNMILSEGVTQTPHWIRNSKQDVFKIAEELHDQIKSFRCRSTFWYRLQTLVSPIAKNSLAYTNYKSRMKIAKNLQFELYDLIENGQDWNIVAIHNRIHAALRKSMALNINPNTALYRQDKLDKILYKSLQKLNPFTKAQAHFFTFKKKENNEVGDGFICSASKTSVC